LIPDDHGLLSFLPKSDCSSRFLEVIRIAYFYLGVTFIPSRAHGEEVPLSSLRRVVPNVRQGLSLYFDDDLLLLPC
jgi:hypothetical protein